MNIYITKGEGHGQTKMAAFDSSLKQAGVYNYNLIRLSSIIPPKSKVHIGKSRPTLRDEYGNRLYAVYADARTNKPGEWVGAIVAWVQLPDGRGIFTEHEGADKNVTKLEKRLITEATKTVEDLCDLRGFKFSARQLKHVTSFSQAKRGLAADALVVASYQSVGWK